MYYSSLQNQSPSVDFRTATIQGQAPDGGLYFPEQIPQLPKATIEQLPSLSREEIAYQVIQPFVGDSIPESKLREIVTETINFPIPLKQVHDQYYSLELFHGPTLAFKDIGARFMSRCLGYFAQEKKEPVTVLVATSGDTGGAVASGFHNVEGVRVVILYPSGKVSSVQEKQLTTFGDNIQALEVQGNFDDCQQMVKQAFKDPELTRAIFLTSANSINVARWLPQQFYYFFALQQWKELKPPVICVPSGNFGNICAGLMAWKAGLPVAHFIAACNANDVVPRFLETGAYHPQPAIPTISNAMDVGNPSNFTRILEIFQQNTDALKRLLSSSRTTDEKTRDLIRSVYRQHSYLLDPHGAVAYDALQQYLNKHPEQKGILLETAHPIKFLDVVEPIIETPIPVPDSIAETLTKTKKAYLIGKNYEELKAYLLNSNPF
ncbi:threonine synthase [Flavihumibacter sp. CACIAM 22H1]|uniref:threonine synthase n=1 Tax=Flavihumibacter sp. CACIAM 22H1 TaxID=1812911 RepID=UPI0007A89149|nr:threonine synthase [Flavihumibacter sp. CACIAM 22H1]KYP13170.1 MAG: threonine synthase [Flavihumibacter sp. CACIAM 22H1]